MLEQKIKEATDRAGQLLLEHGLYDWRVAFNRKTTSVAEVWHPEKVMFFSKRFIAVATREEFEGVAIHEIAHALLGHGKGHGEEFVELCLSMTLDEKYARGCVAAPVHDFKATCPRCKYSGYTNKKKDLYCVSCFNEGVQIKFERERNSLDVKAW